MNETLVAKDVVAKDVVAQDYRQLVEQFGSPLLLLDKAAVRKQYRALAAALPDVRLHYALKPLPHEAVVAVLKEEGACFDLATNGEVDLVRSQGSARDVAFIPIPSNATAISVMRWSSAAPCLSTTTRWSWRSSFPTRTK